MEQATKPNETEAGAQGASAEPARKARRRGLAATAVAIGAVLLEPELLPGIVIGAAAAMAPKLFPRVAAYLRPVTQTVQGAAQMALDKGRELRRKAQERVAEMARRANATEHPPGGRA